MKKVKRVRSTEDIAQGILKFGQLLEAYQRTIARLKGIYAGVSEDKDTAKLVHRVKSILGYRKKCLKTAREFQQAFEAFDAVLAELEG